MSGKSLSLSSKISLVTTAALLAVGVIVLINPPHASDDHARCEIESEALQSIVPAENPEPVPPLSFVNLDGSEFKLEDLRGRGVVLNFWATWCAPCVREMPELDKIKAELQQYKIDVIAASTERGGHGAITKFYGNTGIRHLEALHDPKGSGARTVGVRGLPTTLIINPKGEEVARIQGIHHYDTDETRAYLRRCIGHG